MIEVINPAKWSEVVGRVPACSEADVDRVLDQTQSAFRSWSRTTADERASRLRDAARDLRNALPELATLYVRENGKPLREAEIDIRRSIELMEIIAADLPEWSKAEVIDPQQPVWARRRARGVTAVISPWNSPVLLSLKRFVPAIASGNTAVVKPATYCPLAITECVRIINRHLPNGVLGVVTGSGAVIGEKDERPARRERRALFLRLRDDTCAVRLDGQHVPDPRDEYRANQDDGPRRRSTVTTTAVTHSSSCRP